MRLALHGSRLATNTARLKCLGAWDGLTGLRRVAQSCHVWPRRWLRRIDAGFAGECALNSAAVSSPEEGIVSPHFTSQRRYARPWRQASCEKAWRLARCSW